MFLISSKYSGCFFFCPQEIYELQARDLHEPLPWFPSVQGVATNVTIPTNHACVAANMWRLKYINFEFSNVCFNSQLAVVKTLKLLCKLISFGNFPVADVCHRQSLRICTARKGRKKALGLRC